MNTPAVARPGIAARCPWPIFALAIVLGACAQAAQMRLDVALGQPVLPSDKKNTTYLKVGLTGFALEGGTERPPVNLALVLDHSGSMSGEKIERAKQAAITGCPGRC